jgi:hypothetical protein
MMTTAEIISGLELRFAVCAAVFFIVFFLLRLDPQLHAVAAAGCRSLAAEDDGHDREKTNAVVSAK